MPVRNHNFRGVSAPFFSMVYDNPRANAGSPIPNVCAPVIDIASEEGTFGDAVSFRYRNVV